MPRSVRVRVECIQTVKVALRRNGYARQIDLAEDLKFSLNTVNTFLNGKAIDYLNFIEICNKLSIDWQDIADLEDGNLPQNIPESNTTEQTLSVTVEVNHDLKVNLADSQTNQKKEKRVILQQAIPTVPVWKGRDELLHQLKERLLPREPLETRFLGETGFLNPLKVLAIIGQGGIGKTSLTVKLLEALGVSLGRSTLTPLEKGGTEENCPYEWVMYFKAQEKMSFDEVAEFLLDGLGIATPEPLKSADEKIGKIIAGLAENCCLLVLDNLESVLHPANHPQAGKAVSLDWGKLLNALVYQQHISQTILTSREVPADLADTRYEGAEPDTELVYIEMLTGVSDRAGVEILQQRQLKDKPEDLQWVSGRVEGHVFLLTQLAAIGKGKPGYLRKHPELVTKKAEPILQEQLARQSEAARDLLKRMCVLRVPIDVRGLTFLRLYTDDIEKDDRFLNAAELGEVAEFTDEDIRETEVTLERLVNSSLVQCRYNEHKCELFYDLHAVIAKFLKNESKDQMPNLVKAAYAFYRSGRNVENPKNSEDLRPVIETQYFAFQLGNYSEASSLLIGTLEKYLRRWGHWSLLRELYEQILPHIDDDERPIFIRQIGRTYRDFGNWDIAERYFQQALSIAQNQNIKSEIANALQYLGDIEQSRGNWDEAERLYRQSLQLRTELGDRAGMASSWGSLGDIERNRGNWEQAERLYRQSLQLMTELGDRAGMASSWGLLGDIERMRGNLDAAEQLKRQSFQLRQELGDREGMAGSLGSWGDIERDRGNFDEAERLYQQCLQISRELGMTYKIADTHYDMALLERQRNNPELAQQHYNTAHQIYQQLGAAKDLERIEKEWNQD
ncbi:tetratricopeptide repeat protein [Argonema galeatum]|uniref:tetratricopeptide repeat protein n=1 Tax=Argonema galeatum TaxID=2942762 RepID=UPI0020137520|nr:tetratricopeptide repeat protein [Argonema galeatum]MCL1462987.1 tetratricopeptide repeat protein [Argonema galeatum A003/A1]